MSAGNKMNSQKSAFLEAEIAIFRTTNSARTKMLETLWCSDPEAKKIREWFKKHARRGIGALAKNPTFCNQHIIAEDWEYEVSELAWMMIGKQELTPWDKADNKVRSRHLKRVAKLAEQLADALEETPNPGYPPALVLFDEDLALDLAKAMSERQLEYVSGENCVVPEGKVWHPPTKLSHDFDYPEQQYFPSMLRRLANVANHPVRRKRPEARPNTGEPEPRIFARKLAEYFIRLYGSPWNEIIASCVQLKFPDIRRDNPPSADTIRDWRNAKSREEARADIVEYITMFYNSRRLHSYLGYQSPDEFERNGRTAKAA